MYSYDDKRQLISVTLNGTEIENYDYDANGNRINQSNTQRGINNQSATYNIGDQLQSNGSTTYEYDGDGYLSKKISTDGETTYQYSSQGRLLQVQTPDKTITYQHNALGNRVSKSVNGTVIEKYLWLDKTTLLATYDGNDNLVQRFEYADGNTPTSFTQNNQRYYIITDHLGTPRAITDTNGTIQKRINYDSFGNVLTDSNPNLSIPFGFAGGLNDVDTGLVRFGYRDYDPETGRWTARDPIGFAGGDSNLYGYVERDPVNFVDILGLVKSKKPDGYGSSGGAEHLKGARKSTKKKHQKGQANKDKGRGGEKGDNKRSAPRKKPKGHKGSWPPGVRGLICPICPYILPDIFNPPSKNFIDGSTIFTINSVTDGYITNDYIDTNNSSCSAR